MRANQPMGLSEAGYQLVAELVQVGSDRFYEGYWNERFPLADYVAPDAAMASLLAARAELTARLKTVSAEIQAAGAAMVVAKRHVYSEYEQAVLSSLGPNMFLALRGPDGVPVPASLWSECALQRGAEGECACRGADCAAGCPEGCRTVGEQPAATEELDDQDWGDPQMPV